ncbi:hypothetical protein [Flavobacterium mekongense]|uniref:hypothetical protein n=1 Tax=Flavobacterium mekongense TaxID=3379707 RepID=UPI003999A12E
MATRGTFAAYNKLTPLSGSVTDDLMNQEQLGFQRRAEKRAIDQIAKQEEEKKQAKKEALREKVVKNIRNYDTGSRSLNEVQGKLIQKALNEYGPIIETLENPKATDDEKLRAQLKAQNIANLPENLKLVTDFYTNQDVAYRQGVLNKKLHRNPEYEKIFQNGFENYVLELDDLGLPVVAFTDKNNDGKIDVLDVQDYEQIKRGLPTFNFQPMYDKENLVKEAITKIQPEVNQVVQGDRIIKTTSLNDAAVEKHVNDLFYNADGSPTEVLRSFAISNGVDMNDSKGMNAIKEDFINSMNLYAKRGREESVNPESRQWAEFNYRKNQDAEKKQTTTFNTVETPPIYSDAKVTPANGYKTVAVSNSKPVPLVQLYVNGKKREITNGTINSYTVTKDKIGRRRVYVEMVYQDSKSSTLSQDELAMLDNPNTDDATRELLLTKQNKGPENKSVVGYLTEKDLKKFANQNNMTTSQMANKARVGKEKDTRPKTVVQNGITYTWNENTGTYE